MKIESPKFRGESAELASVKFLFSVSLPELLELNQWGRYFVGGSLYEIDYDAFEETGESSFVMTLTRHVYDLWLSSVETRFNNAEGYGTAAAFVELLKEVVKKFPTEIDTKFVPHAAWLRDLILVHGITGLKADWAGAGDSGYDYNVTVEPESVRLSEKLRDAIIEFFYGRLAPGIENGDGGRWEVEIYRDGVEGEVYDFTKAEIEPYTSGVDRDAKLITAPYEPGEEEFLSLLSELREMETREVVVSFTGYGDSGQFEDTTFEGPMSDTLLQRIATFFEAEQESGQAPEVEVNNEGGQWTATIDVVEGTLEYSACNYEDSTELRHTVEFPFDGGHVLVVDVETIDAGSSRSRVVARFPTNEAVRQELRTGFFKGVAFEEIEDRLTSDETGAYSKELVAETMEILGYLRSGVPPREIPELLVSLSPKIAEVRMALGCYPYTTEVKPEKVVTSGSPDEEGEEDEREEDEESEEVA